MMKKILTFAICVLAIGSMSAQKDNIKAAKKLAGKIDKIEDARTLIREALNNPETTGDPATYILAGDIEFKGYEAMKKNAAIQGSPEDLLRMDGLLLKGFPYYVKAAEMGAQQDASMKVFNHMNDFFQAGADFFNNKKFYPEAYEAFMIYGDLPTVQSFKPGLMAIPDSVRATAYFNAGLAGWSANELDAASKAFKAARMAGYPEPQAYVYELACWQNIMQRDTTEATQNIARTAIEDVSMSGYRKFGLSQPVFLNNLVNVYVENDQDQKAIDMLNGLIAANQAPQLYGLRAFVYDRMDKSPESVADYLKAASYADCDFETLKNASKKLYRNATEELNALEISAPNYREARAQIKADLENTLKIAERAKAATPQGTSTSDIDYVIESIQYQLDGLK